MRSRISVRKLCLLSSYACSIVATIYGWNFPISDIASIFNEVFPEKRNSSLQCDFDKSVQNALKRIAKSGTVSGHKKVFQELMNDKIDVLNLKDLISQTKSMRDLYYTNKDINDMVETFERILKEEISKHEQLSDFLSLEIGTINLKKLETIYDILTANTDQLNKIKSVIDESYKIIGKSYIKINTTYEILNVIQKIFRTILSTTVYTFSAMFIFLIFGMLYAHGFDTKFIVAAPISYFVADMLVFKFKNQKILTMCKGWLVQAIITVSIFAMILCANNVDIIQLTKPTIALIVGGLFAVPFRNLLYEKNFIN